MPACHSFTSMNIVHLKIIIQYSAPICILNTSKWKQSEPVCIPLSSCLMDSSSVGGRSDGPGERGFSSCGWMLSVRVGSECSRGVPRPGPVLEGQFKACNKYSLKHDGQSAHLDHMLSQHFCLTATHAHTNTHKPLRLMSKVSCLVCDSLLARMNMTTWSCVCSEMSRPLISTTRSPSMSLGSLRSAYKQQRVV